jgi:alginate O-acetyltransferase complex protein AlgI
MLFNSFDFVYVFLPAVVIVFFLLGRASRTWALRWVIAASLFFYGWWRPLNLLIILPSVLINFFLARWLQSFNQEEQPGAARFVLLLGIAFNVAFLGYFKYSNFLVDSANDAFGTHVVLARVILPLGISFITFQKIAFLIDVQAGRIESFTLQDYCLFVLFFPQLIAGPIVHYREMMPQFHRASCRLDKDNVSVGLTLLAFGLFKKVLIADNISLLVSPIYQQAAAGGRIGLFSAWVAAFGFTLQIYFDFSGYTDMALGVARLFGIRLPPNFNSPLRALNIIDFWQRWHMTLTRFLTAYIYNPLTLWLTRRRASRSKSGLVAPNKHLGAFIELLLFPLLLTMLVSGIWHGAGYTFIVWGVLHGLYLVINHAWRILRPRIWHDKARYERMMMLPAWAITLVSVTVSMLIFRADSLHTASNLLQGVLGLHGIGFRGGPGPKFVALTLAAPAFIAFICPNTLQILSRFEPALGWKPTPLDSVVSKMHLMWQPSLVWAAVIAAILAVGILNLGGNSEFLYWQF